VRKSILIVDDDKDLRSELIDLFEGHRVEEASSGEQAIEILRRAHGIGLVILDVRMPGIRGTEVLEKIKNSDPDVKVIILTGYSSKNVAIEALKNRADDYIEKPIDISELIRSVSRLLEESDGRSRLEALGSRGKVSRARRFIEDNSLKRTFLTDVARDVCLSPKYLSRVFKKHAGMGFGAYRARVKNQRAVKLLAESGYNINQISDKLGYENAESFMRQFKKRFGCTPTEFRKKKRKGTRAAGESTKTYLKKT